MEFQRGLAISISHIAWEKRQSALGARKCADALEIADYNVVSLLFAGFKKSAGA
jgi:hypothetical protein